MGDWDEVEAAALAVIVCGVLALASLALGLIVKGLA
jgi:hypothetical protein